MQQVNIYDKNNARLCNLVQWDKDVHIKVKEPYITKAYNVHFFKPGYEEALVVNTEFANGVLTVKVPNVMLEDSSPIIGYIYVEDDGEGRSLYAFKLVVERKPKPSSYVHDNSFDYVDIVQIKADMAEQLGNAQKYAKQAQEIASSVQKVVESIPPDYSEVVKKINAMQVATAAQTKEYLGIS